MSTVQEAAQKANALLGNPTIGSITPELHLDMALSIIGAITNSPPVQSPHFNSFPTIPILRGTDTLNVTLPTISSNVPGYTYSIRGTDTITAQAITNGQIVFDASTRRLTTTAALPINSYNVEYAAQGSDASTRVTHQIIIHKYAAIQPDITMRFGYGDATASADASFGSVAGKTSFNIAFPQVPATTPLDGTHFYWIIWTDTGFTPTQMINSLGINQYPADWELVNNNRALKSKSGIIRRAGAVNYTLIGTRS